MSPSPSRTDALDEAGVGPDPKQVRHLTPLRELRKWRVARGEPDIRGWHVFTSNGRDVGHVAELLVDETIAQVVMFDIAVRRTGETVLAPIRAAWVDRPHKRVILDSAQAVAADDVLPTLGREAAEATPEPTPTPVELPPPARDTPERLPPGDIRR